MAGAFQTSRDIFENPIWQNIVEFRLFFLIYGQAIFKEEGYIKAGVKLEKGQWVRSYRNLQLDLEYIENRAIKKYSLSTIKRAVDHLVKDERIKIEQCELGTLFTVLNYARYQGLDNYKWNNENAERTQSERRENNNKKEKKDKKVNNNNSIHTQEAIDYLNLKADTHYQPTSKKTQTLIKARMNEGFTIDDIKKAIDIKTEEWLDTDMSKFLRPETLFGTKFESYLNQKSKEEKYGQNKPIPMATGKVDYSAYD